MYADTYTVQVDGMLTTKGVSEAEEKQQTCAHRSCKSKRRDCEFDTLVGFETIDAARGKEVRGIRCTAQDLEQHRNGRRCEGFTINSEFTGSLSIGRVSAGANARKTSVYSRMKYSS